MFIINWHFLTGRDRSCRVSPCSCRLWPNGFTTYRQRNTWKKNSTAFGKRFGSNPSYRSFQSLEKLASLDGFRSKKTVPIGSMGMIYLKPHLPTSYGTPPFKWLGCCMWDSSMLQARFRRFWCSCRLRAQDFPHQYIHISILYISIYIYIDLKIMHIYVLTSLAIMALCVCFSCDCGNFHDDPDIDFGRIWGFLLGCPVGS